MRPRFAILAITAAVFLITPSLRAADVQWPSKIGAWSLGSTSNDAPRADTSDPVLRESGLVGASTRVYNDGAKSLPITLYTFHDSTGAFEAFTFLRGRAASMDTNNAVVVSSNIVLWLRGISDANLPELKEILSWAKSASDGVASPPVADYISKKDLELFSERYTEGSVGFIQAAKEIGRSDSTSLANEMGFDSHAEAMLAKYKSGKDEATLLLIDYPTPQLAELHMRHLRRALADAKLTTSSIERKGSLLSIVLAPTSAEYAEKLRSSVNYETQVTWNEAGQTATDPPILSTVAKIFIATGVFMVVTVVIGIAFGGVRIITKRLFPGKVFDRKDQIEVLQLGLSGKPIDPSDMY
jgi:hypothetical protein